MAKFYARMINRNKFKKQVVFQARFGKQDQDDQVLDKIELYNQLNINENLTESDIDFIDVKYQLEKQIQNQKTTDSSCRSDKINPITIIFYKITENNASI